jgi:hypothetical protein
MTDARLIVHTGDQVVDPDGTEITLTDVLTNVVEDLMAGGTLTLERIGDHHATYPVPVIVLPAGGSHTYVTGPGIPNNLRQMARTMAPGTTPYDALFQLAGDLSECLKAEEVELLRSLPPHELAGVVAHWIMSHIDEAFDLMTEIVNAQLC